MGILDDDPDFKRWLARAEADVLPKMKSSVISLAILSSKIDAKLCIEIGAAVLYGKPIIVLALDDEPIPATLEKCAAAIVRGDPKDAATKQRLTEAIERVLPGFKPGS